MTVTRVWCLAFGCWLAGARVCLVPVVYSRIGDSCRLRPEYGCSRLFVPRHNWPSRVSPQRNTLSQCQHVVLATDASGRSASVPVQLPLTQTTSLTFTGFKVVRLSRTQDCAVASAASAGVERMRAENVCLVGELSSTEQILPELLMPPTRVSNCCVTGSA